MTRLVNAILDAFFGQFEELEWGGADAITHSRDGQILVGNIELTFLKKMLTNPQRQGTHEVLNPVQENLAKTQTQGGNSDGQHRLRQIRS
jgi:hypothetical protein